MRIHPTASPSALVIALGAVRHEEGALVADTAVLTAWIDAVTPPDEIELSAAAWLAVPRRRSAPRSSGTSPLEDFDDPVSVYRVEQTYRLPPA